MQEFNKKLDWWNQTEGKLDCIEYKVGDTIVQVGIRPNIYGMNPEEYKSIDAWLNVSDRFVPHDKNVTNSFIPWVEAGQPQLETIWAALQTLHYWIDVQKLKRVYISCDLGTHRAPTIFGLYLIAFHKENAKEIADNLKLVNRPDISNAYNYASGYIEENKVPVLSLFLETVSKQPSDDHSHGPSLESVLKYQIGEKNLTEYFADRFTENDLPTAWHWVKHNVWFFISHNLVKWPWLRFTRFIHKKLNTKTGQKLKKLGF